MDIDILHEDDALVAVDKPSGVSTIPNNDTPRESSLVGIMERKTGQKLFVVHRLDKDTSGVVLFAKTPEAHRALSMQFEGRKVKKQYLAIVKGEPEFNEKTISIPMSKAKMHKRKAALASKGVETITMVRKINRAAPPACRQGRQCDAGTNAYDIVEVEPVTGRRHQIRLHLKAIGHPLALDPIYGGPGPVKIGEGLVLNRMPLHAVSITAVHPATGKELRIEAPVPEELVLIFKELGYGQ